MNTFSVRVVPTTAHFFAKVCNLATICKLHNGWWVIFYKIGVLLLAIIKQTSCGSGRSGSGRDCISFLCQAFSPLLLLSNCYPGLLAWAELYRAFSPSIILLNYTQGFI